MQSASPLGLARSNGPAAVPGVGGGAGEVGGVGLPESTGGQARVDGLALPATAPEGREQIPEGTSNRRHVKRHHHTFLSKPDT